MSPQRRRESWAVGLATLAGLYLAFLSVLPPLRTHHLIGDIEGYHYPLLDYTFQSLKEGRFPLWDPWIYSGTSFVANIQAQIFYPPAWLLYAAQWNRKGLTFLSLQIFALGHLWLLLQFTYWWLRSGRGLPAGASLIGATILGFAGYAINDLQHLGAIGTLTWMPLALWGVDRKRLWMIALASALSVLAGYPASWLACASAVAVYALLNAFMIRTLAAMALSLAAAAVQLLPTWEITGLRPFEPVFGGGSPPEWLLLRLWPGGPFYLYWGAGFPAAVILFLTRRPTRPYLQPLALATAALFFMQDPLHAASAIVTRIPELITVMQHWHFQIVLNAAAALFAALAWSPLAKKHPRAVLALVIPLLWFEQHWLGVRSAPNLRAAGNGDDFFKDDARRTGDGMVGMDPATARLLRSQPHYRTVSEQGPHATDMRFYRIPSPEGFDPFLTSAYRAEVEQFTAFRNNREFSMSISDDNMLRAFAVRYYISHEGAPNYEALLASPRFRLLDPHKSYYKTFEYLHAEPAFRMWNGSVEFTGWTPERRTFRVHASEQGGQLALLEQFLPGWRVRVDGAPAKLERFSRAFMAVRLAQGEHTVEFNYAPVSLFTGFAITCAALLVLLVLACRNL